MKFPRKLFGFLVVIVILGLAGTGVWWRLKPATDPAASGDTPADSLDGPANSATDAFSTDMAIPVEGAQVTRGDLILEVQASGQATSPQAAVIKALVGGQVKSVPVRDNSPVGVGSLLVLIDSTEARLTLDDARASLEQRQATFRELTIGDDLLVGADTLIRAERQRNARIKSGIEQAEIAVRRSELALERTRVTAPFGGRVASVKVVPGQQVNVGDELMTVLDLDPIRIEVQVLESEVGNLRTGGGAVLTLAAFPGEAFHGRVETVNPLVDETTRKAKVTVSVPNRDARILPGMYANVVLDARHIPDCILVPVSAILERDIDRRTMLFVFDGQGTDGAAEWRYVTPGLRNSKYVQIIENPEPGIGVVKPGEIVLVGGHYTLTHGAPVRLTANAAAEGGRPR
jgi:HlyD family secretion protein